MTSNQHLFNLAVAGLATQQFWPAMNERATLCYYRGPDGFKCAVGHLLPDADYNPDFETFGVSNCTKLRNTLERLYPGYDLEFLTDLQVVHDNSSTPGDMVERLIKFTKERNLEVPDELAAAADVG